jgi:predicted nucleic acid-binding protein
MNIFIDTNVLLSFYEYSKEDLEELRKLVPIVNNSAHKLLLTKQVVDEFYRNRENVIANTLKEFEREVLKIKIPPIFKSYEEHVELTKSMENSAKIRSKLIDSLKKDISNELLVADQIVESLFSKGFKVETTEETVKKAELRLMAGNPPGKGKSLGDAINWECLLNSVANGEELHLISQDSDYSSDFDNQCMSQFLLKEWKAGFRGEIHYYKSLTSFFKLHFSNIHLADQLEVELLIKDLIASSNFASSRRILKMLSRYENLSDMQLNAIVDASISNNQIYWIAADDDIKEYLDIITRGHESKINDVAYKKLMGHMTSESGKTSEIPF